MPFPPDAGRAHPRTLSVLALLSGEQKRRAELAELFRTHHTSLVKVLARRLRCGQALAEDACAYAWLQLWRKRPDDRSRIAGWLYVVALHEGYRLLAIQRRELPGPGRAADGGNGAPLVERIADPRSPELALEAKQALQALASLTRGQRDTLALQVAGYSYREIQAVRGVSYTNVNRHVSEGRAAARRLRDAA